MCSECTTWTTRQNNSPHVCDVATMKVVTYKQQKRRVERGSQEREKKKTLLRRKETEIRDVSEEAADSEKETQQKNPQVCLFCCDPSFYNLIC